MTTGHEDASTETLLAIRENLINGLKVVADHFIAGTEKISKKEGSAPPAEAGWTTVILLLGVEDELETRIRGFQRTIDPKLLPKTL